MPITRTTSFATNVILSDVLGTAAAPSSYFGFANASGGQVASTGPRVQASAGNPSGVVTSPAGSIWVDTTTGLVYYNVNGAAGWKSDPTRLGSLTALNDQVTAVASAGAYVDFATTVTLPADFFGAGTCIRILAKMRCTDATGVLTFKMRAMIGATMLVETTAVDPGATTDFQAVDCDVNSYSAASAASPLDATSSWATNTGGTVATGVTSLDRTNFATNGALVVTIGCLWSAAGAGTSAILDQFLVTGG
jgi:hypothetical protein